MKQNQRRKSKNKMIYIQPMQPALYSPVPIRISKSKQSLKNSMVSSVTAIHGLEILLHCPNAPLSANTKSSRQISTIIPT
eukprot:c27995_g1_i1 orf=73-312(+)